MDFIKCELFPFTKLGFTLEGLCLDRGGNFFTQHGSHILDLRITDSKTWLHSYRDETVKDNLSRLQHILKHCPNVSNLHLTLDLLPIWVRNKGIFDDHELPGVRLTQVTVFHLDSRSFVTTEFLNGFFLMCPNAKKMGIQLQFAGKEQQSEAVVEAMQNVKFRFDLIYTFPKTECVGLWNEITNS